MATPDAISLIKFVDNEDCQSGINRSLLPTAEVMLALNGNSLSIVAEVADESSERRQGLMCREIVPLGTGMLFVFEQLQTLSFWMFNTYAPLDILYLDNERRVVNALRMEPCPRPSGYDDTAWRSACSGAGARLRFK